MNIRLASTLAVTWMLTSVCLAQPVNAPVPARRAPVFGGRMASPAKDANLHLIQGGGVGFPWTLTGPGNIRWQVNTSGALTGGAFKAAMQLEVNGTSFPGPGVAVSSPSGTEIELAPGTFNNNVRVYRRILISTEQGYGRWIDIIEASAGQPATVNLRYWFYSAAANSLSGKTNNDKDTWIALPADNGTQTWPALVYASSDSEGLRPTIDVAPSGDNVSCRIALTVQPDKPVALCFFIVQQKSAEAIAQTMQKFSPHRELANVSPELRKIILNMPPPTGLPGLDVDRDFEADVVRLRSGDQLRGRITNQAFEIKSAFGPMRVPSANVVALVGVSSEQDTVKLGTTDGQVLLGELAAPLTIKLSGGSELTVGPRKMRQAAFQVTDEKPDSPNFRQPLVILQRGECLAFDPAGVKLDFLTSSGKVTIDASQAQLLETSVPQGVHRLVLRNGTVLSGLMSQDAYKLKLALAGDVTLPAWQVKQIRFAASPQEDPAQCRVMLENHDVLRGRFTDATWKIRGDVGDVEAKPEEIAKADFSEGLGSVQVELKNGTRLGGKLLQEYVTIRLEPGPEMKIFTGKIESITGGRDASTPTSEPTPPPVKPQPAAKPAQS